MDIRDSQRIKEIRDNTAKMADAFTRIADALECLADRKTENSSEKPNNCEVKNYCDDCLYTDTCDDKAFFYACTSKATISKMEQVDKDINVRSKDERQTEIVEECDRADQNCEACWKKLHCRAKCYKCETYWNCQGQCDEVPQIDTATNVGRKDEPQTDCPWK